MADGGPTSSDPTARAGRQPGPRPGWREVLVLGAAVVAIVLGAAILTSLLPTEAQQVVFHTPLLIVVLIVGTVAILWRIARRSPPD